MSTIPLKRESIARCDNNCIRGLRIPQEIAAQINAGQIFHRGAVVAWPNRAVVCRCSDT